MQKLKIKNPKLIEKQIYKYLHSSEEAKYVHRLHGILLLITNENNNCSSVAALFKNSPRSLSNWVHLINRTGNIEALIDKPKPGRRSKLNDEQLKQLKIVIQKHPSEVDLTANIWDGKTLSFYIEREFSISLKVRQCQRLFRKLGFRLKRARPIVAKGNPEKKEQAKKTFRK
jgi:transposase